MSNYTNDLSNKILIFCKLYNKYFFSPLIHLYEYSLVFLDMFWDLLVQFKETISKGQTQTANDKTKEEGAYNDKL